MQVTLEKLSQYIIKILSPRYSHEDAQKIAEELVFCEAMGRPSHGMIRLIKKNYGPFDDEPQGKLEFIEKTPVSGLVKVSGHSGILALQMAVDYAAKIALEKGIAIIGTSGHKTSSGSLTYYANKLAKKNLISIMTARAGQCVAAFDSKEKLFGTNPICFGFPTEDDPLIFDMATSSISFGDVAQTINKGEKLPDDLAIDQDGKMTNDPVEALKGALLPFGSSYKGSGLNMVVEILAGVLTGSGFIDMKKDKGWGDLLIVLSPSLLSDEKTFKKDMKDFIERLKSSSTSSGSPLRLPSERFHKTYRKSLQDGYVEISDKTMDQIVELHKIRIQDL